MLTFRGWDEPGAWRTASALDSPLGKPWPPSPRPFLLSVSHFSWLWQLQVHFNFSSPQAVDADVVLLSQRAQRKRGKRSLTVPSSMNKVLRPFTRVPLPSNAHASRSTSLRSPSRPKRSRTCVTRPQADRQRAAGGETTPEDSPGSTDAVGLAVPASPNRSVPIQCPDTVFRIDLFKVHVCPVDTVRVLAIGFLHVYPIDRC